MRAQEEFTRRRQTNDEIIDTKIKEITAQIEKLKMLSTPRESGGVLNSAPAARNNIRAPATLQTDNRGGVRGMKKK